MSTETAAWGAQASRGGTGLARYLTILRERWILILLSVVLVVAVAAVYVQLAPRRYQAQAELLVQAASPSNQILSTLPVIHQTGDPTEDILTGATVVTTPTVAQAVVRALHLHVSPSSVLADVQANPVGQTGLVAIQAQASSPQFAARLANAFAEQTIATSTARLHAALDQLVPALRARVAELPVAVRNGPGTLGDELAQLELLQQQADPTLQLSATATPPPAPFTPRKKLALIAGLFGGLLLGIGAALGANSLDPRLLRVEQLEEWTSLPVFATIPAERGSRRRHRPLLPRELSFMSQEGYRLLRATLTVRARGRSVSVLVTGSMPSEGKTTTAVNLASALAQTGARVLLIEGDLRRPSLGSIFKVVPRYTIEDVIHDEVSVAEAAEPVAVDQQSFRVILSRGSDLETVNLLTAETASRVIDEGREIADFVVIDSAPLPTVMDALPFAQHVDELVIVTRIGRSRINRVVALDRLLMQHNAPTPGLVVIGEAPMDRDVDGYYGTLDDRQSARG